MQIVQQAVVDTGLVVTVAPFQQQLPESNNCGLFCITAAVEIAESRDACSVNFDESKLRSHLITCVEQGKLSCFRAKESSGAS